MELKIKRLNIGEYQRIIVMSDIHGAYSLFQKALNKVNYHKEDVLMIVGDLCERGEDSLSLVRKVMKLSQTHEVYCVMGNCDTIFEDIALEEEENNQEIKEYMLTRKHSILNEMCQELGIEVNEQLNVADMKKQLQIQFKEELDFLASIPIIIESEDYLFVHAGLEMKHLEEQNPIACLTMPEFMTKDVYFDKTVVVGHWPVSNYNKEINCSNVLLNHNKNIIGMDGGNTIKLGGQLNIMVIENKEIKTFAVDEYPLIEALENQQEDSLKMNLSFPYTEVEILEERDVEVLCNLRFYQKKQWFNKNDIYTYKNKCYCEDRTIHDLYIEKGDKLSLLKQEKKGVLVKKQGIIGWYYGAYRMVKENL